MNDDGRGDHERYVINVTQNDEWEIIRLGVDRIFLFLIGKDRNKGNRER